MCMKFNNINSLVFCIIIFSVINKIRFLIEAFDVCQSEVFPYLFMRTEIRQTPFFYCKPVSIYQCYHP